jgi:hypothetical protein
VNETPMGLGRIAGAWLLLAVLMIGNGLLREVGLVPAVGRAGADVLSAMLGIAIVLLATRPFLRPLSGAPTGALIRVSLLWLVATVAFEFLFGHYVDGKSWSELAGDYAIWRGRLWPIVLAALVLAPFVWGRWLVRAPAPRSST